MKPLILEPLTPREEFHFWAKVKKTETCWLWVGCLDAKGYGRFGVKCQNRLAHRVSFFLHHGFLTDGLEVCHSCDHPACVNPDHLFEGTEMDNKLDSMAKGRHWPQKFTPEQVREVRRLRSGGASQYQIARAFDVAHSTVQDILNGRTYQWVSP